MEVAPAAKQLLPMARGPNSPSSSTSSSSPSSAAASPSSAAASPSRRHQQQQPLPPSPRPVPRVIDTTPFPTTFVQADTASFKHVVQMLTGADTPPSPTSQKPPAKNHNHNHGGNGGGGGLAGVPCRPKKQAFKLYERRSGLSKNLKMIAPLAMAAAAGASPRKAQPDLLSPSVLDFPSLALGSPVTPLVADPFNRSPASASPSPGDQVDEAAERATIARRGFFLRPSPRAAEPPRLLPLFPVTSPRMASAAAAAVAPSSQ